jgi:hypothetical protein
MIQDIDATVGKINEHANVAQLEVDATQKAIAAFRTEIDNAISTLTGDSERQLQGLFDDAAATAERAATQATKAISLSKGEGADSARIAAARAMELSGMIAWARARAAAEQIDMFQRLQADGSMLSSADASDQAAQLQAAHGEAMAAATAALEQAVQQLDGVRSRSSAREIDIYKQTINANLAGLAGEEINLDLDLSLPMSGGSTPSTAMSGAPASGGAYRHNPTGASSPEELLEKLRGLETGDTTINGVLELIAPFDSEPNLNASARMIMQHTLGLFASVGDLDQAMTEKFGGGLITLAEGGQGMMPTEFPTYELGEIGDDSAAITVIQVDGTSEQGTIIKHNDRWFLALGDISQISGMGQEMLDPAAVDVIRQLNTACQGITAQVRSGSISSIEALQEAVGMAVMKALGLDKMFEEMGEDFGSMQP